LQRLEPVGTGWHLVERNCYDFDGPTAVKIGNEAFHSRSLLVPGFRRYLRAFHSLRFSSDGRSPQVLKSRLDSTVYNNNRRVTVVYQIEETKAGLSMGDLGLTLNTIILVDLRSCCKEQGISRTCKLDPSSLP
ncbi:hypothetical protein HHX47_DHR4000446, partial [Lentinula edodes]